MKRHEKSYIGKKNEYYGYRKLFLLSAVFKSGDNQSPGEIEESQKMKENAYPLL